MVSNKREDLATILTTNIRMANMWMANMWIYWTKSGLNLQVWFFYQHKKGDPTNKGMNSQETPGMEDDEQADFDHSSYHPDK